MAFKSSPTPQPLSAETLLGAEAYNQMEKLEQEAINEALKKISLSGGNNSATYCYPSSGGSLGGFVYPATPTTPTGFPYHQGNATLGGTISSSTVFGKTLTSDKEVKKELESLVINIEKYEQLSGSLKKMADEFFAAIHNSTSISGKNILVFNTLQTYEVLVSRDASERIRKLTALTEE